MELSSQPKLVLGTEKLISLMLGHVMVATTTTAEIEIDDDTIVSFHTWTVNMQI